MKVLLNLKENLMQRLKQAQNASPDSSKSCILFHAINGIGLGHVSRLAAIALAIRERNASTALLFVVEGGSQALLEAANLPYLIFPSKSNIYSARWDSWSTAQRDTLLRSMAESIIAATSPSLIVFDCFPNPPLVNVAQHNEIPFGVCVRKSKDMDQHFKALAPILLQAKVIIAPHSPDELVFPKELAGKSHFVGPIVRPFWKSTNSSNSNERLVVISGGGGGYPGTVKFYNLALKALAQCQRRDSRLSGLLVTGPLFREWRQLRLNPGDVQITPFDPQITSVFSRAALVICQAGYNTVAEVISSGVPAICVPAERKFDDQFERARAMAGAYQQFHAWEGSESEALATFILDVLQMPRTANSTIDSQGAARAGEILTENSLPGCKSMHE